MTRARDFADVISGQFDIPAGSLGNAQSELSTLSTITTVSGSNDKVVLRDDTDGSMKLATITNAALQGPQGPAGADGAAGATGATGPAGADGAAGAAGTGNAVNVIDMETQEVMVGRQEHITLPRLQLIKNI